MKPEDSIRAMAALADYDLLHAEPLFSESRNTLWRATLDAPIPNVVLKAYDPSADPHAANRCRREEKVLTLLAAANPRVAPRVVASFVSPSSHSLLLMEDAGTRSLADRLMSSDAGSPAAQWGDAVAFVRVLHAELERQKHPLYRTAMAISLDRISMAVLTKRFRIAGLRIVGQTPPPGVRREYDRLMRPLRASPKAVIHNSLSPLNIVIGPDGWRAVDWETLTYASPLWDWAELLRAPYAPLPLDECQEIAVRETGAEAGLFQRAALSRCLDSLATVTLRRRRYEEEGRGDRAIEYARRAACYVDDIQEMMNRLEPPSVLARWLNILTGRIA